MGINHRYIGLRWPLNVYSIEPNRYLKKWNVGAIEDLTDDPTWIVDPIDGTTNFVHGFPYSCVSIALVVSKSSVVGVVYDPFKSELYQVVKGSGAYLNSQRIFVSKVTQLKDALVVRF